MHISFNRPPLVGSEKCYIEQALNTSKLSGDGPFGKRCQAWFEEKLSAPRALLTPSCTAALEMAAILINIAPGDEVIMPSYTFVSTANAFVLRGAKIVFVDIRPDTMNIDETLIETAITNKTKAIIPVHYAGVACEMDTIMDIASRHNLFVIEDAAQGMMSTYNGKPLGTIGDFGAYSFHETKNYTSGGEGGLLIINLTNFEQRAEIVREKGTNRQQFFDGKVDKYTWVDVGSSYLPSELQAAYLWGQLENVEKINNDRLNTWNFYSEELDSLQQAGHLETPFVPPKCTHNAHMFYLKVSGKEERNALIDHLKNHGITAVFHYVPLHSSPAGKQYALFHGQDRYTTSESERLVRLPLYYNMAKKDRVKVVHTVKSFFR